MSDFGIDVLAFGAHPDDVELFCGGTMIRLADLGYSTGVVDLTRGERASNGSPEQRAIEAANAGQVLGLKHRENLGLPDTELDPASHEQVARAVEVLRRLRPEIVLIPWTEERHPDHGAAGELMLRAAFYSGVRQFACDPPADRFVPRQVLHYPMRYRLTLSLIVDTSAAAERKLQAIACHVSQLTRQPGSSPTLISSDRALGAIQARDRYYGSMIGTESGEPLRSVASLGVVDLVKQFRDNPFSDAQAFEPLP